MRIINFYITRTILSTIATVVFVLIGLELFVLLANELRDIGRGDYHIWQAFAYVLLILPQHIYHFFPAACLLGTMLGLGLLASHSELTVMRASGVSVLQIMMAVLQAAFVLVLLMSFLGETVIPRATLLAKSERSLAISSGQTVRTAKGVWSRVGNSFIHIETILSNHSMQGVSRYVFDKQHHLTEANYARKAHYYPGHWVVEDVSTSRLTDKKIISEHQKRIVWPLMLHPELLSIRTVDPDDMSVEKLFSYIRAQGLNRNDTSDYELAFWSRLWQPLATCVMMLLAIPFVFGSLRTATMGSRLLMGISVGFGFYILNQFFGPMSLVYQFPPWLAAALPTMMFAVLAGIMLRRA